MQCVHNRRISIKRADKYIRIVVTCATYHIFGVINTETRTDNMITVPNSEATPNQSLRGPDTPRQQKLLFDGQILFI